MENNISLSANYATIHFYRTKSVLGAIIKPKLRMDGKAISIIKRNWKKTITVPAGAYVFSAKTEKTTKIKLQVDAGKQYYIKCSIGFGFFVGRIKFTQEDAQKAKQQMMSLRTRD